MRIAVDARPLCIKKASGIPTFLRCTLEALGRLDRENEYILYAHRDFDASFAEGFRWRKHVGTGVFGTVWMQTVVPWWILRDRVDLFWGTQHILPLPELRRVKNVLTVHDLIYMRLPGTMEWKNLWINKALIPPSIQKADMIAADSGVTRDDVVDLMGVDPGRIRVVHLGVEEVFHPVARDEARRRIQSTLGFDGPFLLTVGTMEPRKNLLTVLKAFSNILDRVPHQLCVVGPPGWKMEGIVEASRQDVLRNRVRHLGYVPRELLPSLYAAADVFLFPSLYEGFGLPPLEAMACGTPVIVSDASCLPEIVGDGAVLVSAQDAELLSTTIFRLVNDSLERKSLSVRGSRRAAEFRWDRTAISMLRLFHEAVR